MKWLAIILSVLVLTLSGAVNCGDCCPDGDACQTERQETGNDPHDCQTPCSPFSLCGTCVGFVVERPCCIPAKTQKVSVAVQVYPCKIHPSPIINGVWQPPQVA